MRNKETGEIELVVGNKPLLLICVLLLAVAFALGYVTGQNSPRPTNLTANPTASNPSAAEPRVQPQPALPAPASAESSQATHSEAKPSPPANDPPARAVPPAEPQPRPTTQPERHPPEAAHAAKVAEPVGSYWQVAAQASRESAEAVYQTLKEQGLPAVIRPGPGNLTVVWVGPYTDNDSLARAKKRLEDAGLTPTKRP